VRRFVDRAHALGLAVIHDVVYNHLGPDGNYLGQFSPDYFSAKHTTDWGEAINFDGKNCGSVREFFIANAGYWIDEFHMDGLRLDATQNIYDDSEPHILSEVTARVRETARARTSLVIAENEPQHTNLVRNTARGGYGMDGLWNDDFHHSAVVALTGHNDAYYTDYLGDPQEFISALKWGYLYQGQRYKWQRKRRGTPALDINPAAFVTFIENHDQIANSASGRRMSTQTTPGRLKALTALMLLGPGTPMLFQGQEFASSQPFYFFADVPGQLCTLVREGRKEFMKQWRSIAQSEMVNCLNDPCSDAAFNDSKLDWRDAERNEPILRLHTDLLRLRREDPVLSRWKRGSFDGAVLAPEAFLMRCFSDDHGDRLILVNFGRDLHLDPAPEPLLAPPPDHEWEILLSTEQSTYGGCGTATPESDDNWRIGGHSAVVLRAVRA
jgi:maltooligosyltrehalose trehalohydrolase